MKLSERLESCANFHDLTWSEESLEEAVALLREAAALARRVEDAPCVAVIDGGMMIKPFRQYGRFDIPDDEENPSTKEARLLGQFVGQRVRIVPDEYVEVAG